MDPESATTLTARISRQAGADAGRHEPFRILGVIP